MLVLYNSKRPRRAEIYLVFIITKNSVKHLIDHEFLNSYSYMAETGSASLSFYEGEVR